MSCVHGCGCGGQTGVGAEPRLEGIVCVYVYVRVNVCEYVSVWVGVCVCLCVYACMCVLYYRCSVKL